MGPPLYNHSTNDSISFQVGLIFLGFFLQNLVDVYVNYKGFIWTVCRSLFLKRMRISFAYLIRIRVGEELLLVKNERWNLYQPPGGVFECYDDSIFDKFKMVDDEHLKNVSSKDLRKMLTSPKSLGQVIIWFLSRTDRETSPHREFAEELIQTGILSHHKFSNIDFKFIKTKVLGIEYSNHFKCYELKIFEIYELAPTDDQKTELKTLIKTSPDFKLISKKIIEREGFCADTNTTIPLGTQTKYILW